MKLPIASLLTSFLNLKLIPGSVTTETLEKTQQNVGTNIKLKVNFF